MSRRPFIVSVDVEAVPGRAESNHVKTLIYGDFGSEGRCGIKEMMQLGDETGVPMSMFLEMCEVELHGNIIEDVGAEIVTNGHDLHLHLHPNFLPDTYWRERGMIPQNGHRWAYDREAVDAVMADFVGRMKRLRGSVPSCYRAGSFQVSDRWLRAAVREGVTLSSNHNYGSFINQNRPPLAEPDAAAFHWDNGAIEVPVTQVRKTDGNWQPLTFPFRPIEGDPYYEKTLGALARDENNRAPVVLLMHSWSLLQYSGRGKTFSGIAETKKRRFARLLKFVAEHFEPMSFTELAARLGDIKEVRPYPIETDAA